MSEIVDYGAYVGGNKVLDAVQHYAPRNYNNGALDNYILIPGNLRVYGFVVYSTKGTAQYLNVFDASELPDDNAIPAFSWPLPANSGVGIGYTWAGRHFEYGMVLCNSSTDAKKTIGSADCFFDVQYDMVSVYANQ